MASRKVRILGVPLDLGQRRRGVDMGPSAIRAAGLASRLAQLGCEVRDEGDLTVGIPENRAVGRRDARYATEIAKVCERLADRAAGFLSEGWTPLVLGGDHALAVGTLSGAARGRAEPACSGLTPTPTSIRPRRAPRATYTACLWPIFWPCARPAGSRCRPCSADSPGKCGSDRIA